jgi:hypothetical protein
LQTGLLDKIGPVMLMNRIIAYAAEAANPDGVTYAFHEMDKISEAGNCSRENQKSLEKRRRLAVLLRKKTSSTSLNILLQKCSN